MADQTAPPSWTGNPHEEGLRRLLEIEKVAQREMQNADERAEDIIAEQRAEGIIGGRDPGAEKQSGKIVEDAEWRAERGAGSP